MRRLVYVVAATHENYRQYIHDEYAKQVAPGFREEPVRFTHVSRPELLHGVMNSEIRVLQPLFNEWRMPYLHAIRWYEMFGVLQHVGGCKVFHVGT